MANQKEKIQDIEKRLRKEMTEAIKEIEDVVVEASAAYAELKGVIMTTGVGELVADVVLEKVKLPWYVPSALAKGVIKSAVEKLVKKA